MAVTIHTIDAKGKRLGRVASLAASYLMGKHRADFVRHKSPDTRVVIENAGKLVLTESKKTDTVYKRFSGHQGSKVKIETLAHLAERKGYKEGLKLAIRGMLPNNKLRPELLKRLTITD